jgi:hypothetical protein
MLKGFDGRSERGRAFILDFRSLETTGEERGEYCRGEGEARN